MATMIGLFYQNSVDIFIKKNASYSTSKIKYLTKQKSFLHLNLLKIARIRTTPKLCAHWKLIYFSAPRVLLFIRCGRARSVPAQVDWQG